MKETQTELLLDHGATMNDRELDMATRDDRIDVIDELLKRGAQINPLEPQYLNCHSIAAIDVYLKHGIDISGCDKNNSTILHSKAWSDNVELFEHAFKNGAKWTKDSSQRTPYVMAGQGGKHKIVAYLKKNYPALTSHQITPIEDSEALAFEQIYFLKNHPTESDSYYALTQSSRILKYELEGNQFKCRLAVSVDLPTIRNFTFNESHELVVPTADHKLIILNSIGLNLKKEITIEHYSFDQITYLPKKKIYFASDGWTSYILNQDYILVKEKAMGNGIFYPLVDTSEDFITTYCYDQET